MINRVLTAVPDGINYKQVIVESDTNRGLPCFNIVGMANKTIAESRERIRSAINNSGFSFPGSKKIIVNLAPAEQTKNGASLDLPIALSVMAISQQMLQQDLDGRMFVGELSLSGEIRPIKGILNIIQGAKELGIKQLYIPSENATQASLVADETLQIFPVHNLRELWLKLKSKVDIFPLKQLVKITQKDKHKHYLDLIKDQPIAKRAIIIAVAGRHNILMSGPPGVGKTMLAQTIPDLLPPLTLDECIEVTKLHSITKPITHVIDERPFYAPHHSATIKSILGGGPLNEPGLISLAHRGVLFLDEIAEFPRNVLEALRQPLEDHSITINHVGKRITYPADFMLVAAMNPCPCGYKDSNLKPCKCSVRQLEDYQKKLSGPLLDRIDMTIPISNPNNSVLFNSTTISTHEHANAKIQIERALNKQFNRYHNPAKFNASLKSTEIVKYLKLSSEAKSLLDQAADHYRLSARSYFKVIKVAQTISDISEDDQDFITKAQVSEALQYRNNLL